MQDVTQHPLISVIVPVYNVQEYLERCFESIKNQSYKNIEIILVDDGSLDCSGKRCDELAALDERAKVIHKTNGGLSSARNAGIKAAKGEYIGFVDSDDWIAPEMYEKLYSCIEKYKVKVSCCGRFDVDARTMEKTIGLCPIREEVISSEKCLAKLFEWDNIDSSAADKLFHRSIFERFEFPVGIISEDVAVMYKIIAWVDKVAFFPSPLYYYFHRENSITASAFSEKKLCVLENSSNILKFVRRQYPDIEIPAIYFRYKQLMYVYDGIVDSGAYKEKKYKKLMCEIAREFREYRQLMSKNYFKSRKEKIKGMLIGYPNLYILFKKMR